MDARPEHRRGDCGRLFTLRQVHGDDRARVMLNDGLSLATLIDALLRSPLKNRDAVKLITRALRPGDFIVAPDLGSVSRVNIFMTAQIAARC